MVYFRIRNRKVVNCDVKMVCCSWKVYPYDRSLNYCDEMEEWSDERVNHCYRRVKCLDGALKHCYWTVNLVMGL